MDSDYWVRMAAARSLGEIGDARAVSPLVERTKELLVERTKKQLSTTPALLWGTFLDLEAVLVASLENIMNVGAANIKTSYLEKLATLDLQCRISKEEPILGVRADFGGVSSRYTYHEVNIFGGLNQLAEQELSRRLNKERQVTG